MMRPYPSPQIPVVVIAARKKSRQFSERHLVDIALEFDHQFQRNPVFIPAPSIKFGMIGCSEIHIAVAARKLQQKPYLFLAAVMTAGITSDEVVRHFVTKPVSCARDDANMVRQQPHLFVEFAVHRLLRRFAVFDAPLRELPGMGADSFAPENLVPGIEQDDADVGSEPLAVEHNQPQISLVVIIIAPATRESTRCFPQSDAVDLLLLSFAVYRVPI